MARKSNLKKDIELLCIVNKHLRQIQETIKFAGTTDRNKLAKNHIYVSSLAQHLEVIGEIGHRLTDGSKQSLIDISFEDLYRMRNSIAHSYDSISPGKIVSIALTIATDDNISKVSQRIQYCKLNARSEI